MSDNLKVVLRNALFIAVAIWLIVDSVTAMIEAWNVLDKPDAVVLQHQMEYATLHNRYPAGYPSAERERGIELWAFPIRGFELFVGLRMLEAGIRGLARRFRSVQRIFDWIGRVWRTSRLGD